MLVNNWNIYRDSRQSESDRKEAFVNLYKNICVKLKTFTLAQIEYYRLILGPEDILQEAAIEFFRQGERDNLGILSFEGQVVNYFKTIIRRVASRLNSSLNGHAQLVERGLENQFAFEFNWEYAIEAYDIKLYLMRFRMNNRFCFDLIYRRINENFSYMDLVRIYPEYANMNSATLNERHQQCKKKFIKIIRN